MPDKNTNSANTKGGYLLIPGFHFEVEFSPSLGKTQDTKFQEVSGLSAEISVEEVVEGGVNDYVHKLPKNAKYPNLVLKRGMAENASELVRWAEDAINNFMIEPRDILVSLLNNEHEPVKTWNVVNAYPVKLQFSEFNAEKNAIVIETFELAYRYFKIK